MSLCLLTGVVLVCGGAGGVGGSGRKEAGDESNMMGSELVFPAPSECILILDGRLIGESAVVRRLLRSELREDEESVRGEGRLGREYRAKEGFAWASWAAAGSSSVDSGCWVTLVSVPSLRKSIHVSASWARKWDATTPPECCRGLFPSRAPCDPCILRFALSS